MKKRVGIAGLLMALAVGMFPVAASAQDRGYYDRGYAQQRDFRDRDWRRDERWQERERREAFEREQWRQREWREHYRYDRPYSYYGYRPPIVQFRWDGR